MSFATAKVGGSSAGAFAEYLSEQADLVADYYGGRELGGIAFARVQGKAAAHLGVEAGLSMEQFEDLHHGRWNGRQLSQVSYRPVWELDEAGKIVRDGRGHKVPARDAEGKMVTTPYRNSWIDAVWAAPKSVSEYMISTTPEVRAQMIAAWDASCAEGIKAIEDRAYLLRRTISRTSVNGTRQQGSATERVRGAHLLVVPATQLAARHTEETLERGAPPDPHLHTHNAISTLAFLPDPTHPDGMRPLTVDEMGLKCFGEEANAVVMGDYARRLEEMGIELDYGEMTDSRHGTISWEIAGVSPEEIRFHSSNTKRRDAIVQQWEHDYGRPPTRPELDKALRQSRISKKQDDVAKEADRRGVWHLWRADKVAHGLPAPERQPGRPSTRESLIQRRQLLHERLMGPKGLCRDDSDFTADSIMSAIERSAVGLGFTQEQLKNMEPEIRRDLVVTRQALEDRYTYFTTKAQVAKEDRLERGRRFIAKQAVPGPSATHLAAAIDAQDHKLDAQQREAVFAATRRSWVHIEGVAGSGKSSSIGAAREALERAGLIDETIVVATAAATAQRSGRKIGADRYGSVESIERMVQMGKIKASERTLWIIDEAAMVDTDRLDRLLVAAKGKGRFVFVGDPRQLSPIGPGGWYDESVAEHGSVMLDETHRFKDHRDVRDYNLLRRGSLAASREAVENLAMRGRVHESEDRTDRVLSVFEDYKGFRDKGLGADDIRIIVETSNEDVDAANKFAQFDRKSRGEIKGEGVLVHDEDQGRAWRLHENDSVIFLRSCLPSKREEPVRNGTRAKILKIDEKAGRAVVELEDDRNIWVELNEHEASQPMGLAYSQHANKIQGDEVEVVQVMPGTDHTANANSAYSQLTRAKSEAHVYLDRETHGDSPQEALADAWAERVDKRTALSRIREDRSPAQERGRQERRQQTATPEAEPRRAEPRRAEPQQVNRQPVDRDRPADRELRPGRSPVATAVLDKDKPPAADQRREPQVDQGSEEASPQPRRNHIRERETERPTDPATASLYRHIRAPERDRGSDVER